MESGVEHEIRIDKAKFQSYGLFVTKTLGSLVFYFMVSVVILSASNWFSAKVLLVFLRMDL